MLKLGIGICLVIAAATAALAMGGDPLPEPTAKQTPGVSPESVYNRGLILARAEDYAGAEALYRQAIALNPSLPEAWNGLGHALKKQHRYDEALAAYDKALALRPDFALAMQYLGELYIATGETEKARALLIKLRTIDGENAHLLAQAIFTGATQW